jgi:glutaredoxin-dependent peroxiredoxin
MALKTGDRAPEFTLYDTDKKARSLKEFAGKKTVLAFYPGAFTGVCTKEMCSLRDALSVLGTLNAQVVGISVDSTFANKAFAEQNRLGFPLLSDHDRKVAMQYCGVYPDFGTPGYAAAKRSVFVLDAQGVVRYVWISENPGSEPNYDEIKTVLGTF